MVRRADDREVLKSSIRHIVDYLKPTIIVWHGSTQYGVTDYIVEKEIPLVIFPGKGKGQLSNISKKSDA